MYEPTYEKYVQEAAANITRALHQDLNTETKKEHKALLKDGVDKVVKYLESTSNTKTSDSWRKLRRAMVIYYTAAGLGSEAKQIAGTENPAGLKDQAHKPKKRKRLNTVTDEIFDAMYFDCEDRQDTVSMTLMRLARELGLRPAEALGVEMLDFDIPNMTMSIYIEGAKKTKRGQQNKAEQRGIDRILHVPINKELIEAIKTAQDLTPNEIKAAQERIRRAAARLYPHSQRRFCLYSLRYTMGSNLKKKYLNRKDGAKMVAAVIGHKCTSSMSEYGNIKSGASTGTPIADAETLAQVVDDRAAKYGLAEGAKVNPRKVLSAEAVNKRDQVRQPSRRDIAMRQTETYTAADGKAISDRLQRSDNTIPAVDHK
ncbi:hypothetical protein QKW35_17645 [Pontibacterium granulatum]|uniref:hypothetical protein n=1 Tax=Pontibacterium granulatum TaxID=2036029 RepID=UPI00249B5974|nr:hypothetical protein [Pontibacterium granulatum]MDI3326208.1 hypothetical protein [Pontibacterium granulatum]